MADLTPRPSEESDGDSADRTDPDPPYVPGERPRNSWVAPGSSDVVHLPPAVSGDDEHPHRGRRLLARIPGLSSLAEQSGWVGEGSEQTPREDPGWRFHEGGGEGAFEGWLYHYADGTMVDADGTEYAVPTEADPVAEAAPDPEPEPEREPEPEPEPEPEAVAPETEPEAEPAPEPVEKPVEASTPAPVAGASDIPRFVEYTPTSTRGYVLGTIFVVAAVTGVLTIFVGVSEESGASLVIAACCFLLAVVAWWGLLSWRPTVVSIEEGVLEVTRAGRTERFELTDPSTVVEFSGRPGSPTWTATVRNNNGPRTLLRPSQVKPRQFERIVRHHRARARAARSDGAATS